MKSALILAGPKTVVDPIIPSVSLGRKIIHNLADIGDDKNILIIRDTTNPAVLDIASALTLHQYNSRALIVQSASATRNEADDCVSIINQFKQFDIVSLVIGSDSVGSLHTFVSQLFKEKKRTTEVEKPARSLEQIPTIITKTPVTKQRDGNDFRELKHGRTTHEGELIGQYLQPPPMVFSRDGHPMWFGDMYRGRSAFLILGGPSFESIDQSLLDKPGILTMATNNSTKSYRPNLWMSVDTPGNFIKSVWLDPKVTKFVPFAHTEKKIFDNEKWLETDIKVGSCPNVWYYRRNELFIASQFLFEDTFNWGNHKKHGGGRSIMLVALRMLFFLGVRTVYLLGCDFKMDKDHTYHFEQGRATGSIRGNSSTYKMLVDRFKQLKPIFERYGYKIFNCNPDSNLKVFPSIGFEEAITKASIEMPADIKNERTAGLYERQAELRKLKKEKEEKEKEKVAK